MKKLLVLTRVLQHILVSCLTAALTVGPAQLAFAGPTQIAGGNGKGTVLPQGANPNQWTIQVENGAIIHYSSFDLTQGQVATFLAKAGQGGGDIRVLNRIISASPTNIDGSIQQDGARMHIYLMNPAGVFFGEHAQVNVTQLNAAAGRISDTDFAKEVDHFTGLRGKVTVAPGAQIGVPDPDTGAIATRAVSLVGAQVANGGNIRAEGGWIIMAAGRDVLIGRDGDQNGVLLRVEGAAGAVFDKNAVGVENKGSLSATASTDDPTGGHISLGAGDMYGTAIFSNGAIQARKLALSADNRGDVALGGTVKAAEIDATFAGATTGQLRGTGEAGQPAQTVNADVVNLLATDDRGKVKVGSGLAFRGFVDPTRATKVVDVEQKADLKSSDLAGLDLGADRAGTSVTLKSSAGALAVDDRKLVNGTQLDLEGRVLSIAGAETLDVDTLRIVAPTTFSDSDIVARGTDGDHAAIEAVTNIGMVTRPGSATDLSKAALISAHNGTLDVTGDITTSNGGALKIEARDVNLGTVAAQGPLGGTIDVSGAIQPHLEIGFTDASGAQQTRSVTLNAINTEGRQRDETKPKVAGGDVIINAFGDITVRSTINTDGDLGATVSSPNLPGGSVRIASTAAAGKITVGAIKTGGGAAPSAGGTESGEISLSASKINLTGNLDARGGTNGNADGSRDRSVTLDGVVELDSDDLTLFGGDVNVFAPVFTGPKSDTDNTPRDTVFGIVASGETTLAGPVRVDSLDITSAQGKDVRLGGDIFANNAFDVTFNTKGTGSLSALAPLVVSSRSVLLQSKDQTATDDTETSASLALDPNVHFKLLDRPADPTVEGDTGSIGTFTLVQDAQLDDAATSALFTPGRFVVDDPTQTDTLRDKNVSLATHGAIALGDGVRASVANSNLSLDGASFATTGPLDLHSLALKSRSALTVDFDVHARDKLSLASGTDGTGDLTVASHLNSDSIELVAGKGTSGNDGPAVVFDPGATLRAADGVGNAKQVRIAQAADLDTKNLPDPGLFGDGGALAGLDYQLESLAGEVTVSDTTKVQGSKLSLTGATGIDLGSTPLVVRALTATTTAALTVSNAITATDTAAAGGKIELHSATGLAIDATLSADDVELFSGNGSSGATVALQDGAHFLGLSDNSAPGSFLLEQDAAIDKTSIPNSDLFGGPLAGTSLALHSKVATVTIDDASKVAGTALELNGKLGVTVTGDLNVRSLEVTGSTTLKGNVTADSDVTLHDVVHLAPAQSGVTDAAHTITAGGDLTAEQQIIEDVTGDITLHAGGALSVAAVQTLEGGSSITLFGNDSVKASGIVDTSSVKSGLAGGAISVTSNGAIDLHDVTADGFEGLEQTAQEAAGNGSNGGAVTISGTTVNVGKVTATGGSGGAVLTSNGKTGFASGGNGGAISITATGADGVIGLGGNVLADGGQGTSSDTNHPTSGLNGAAGDVTLAGPVRLLASATDGATNEVHGANVTVGGDVGAGSLTDPNTGEVTPVGVGFTGFKVVADDSLHIAGDSISTGELDLELHTGDLDLTGKHINADVIRLAATDGQGTQHNVTPAKVDFDGVTFAGSNGTSPVVEFTLEQDASIGSTPGGTAIPDLARFEGDGSREVPFTMGLVSYDGDVVLDRDDVAKVSGINLLLAANGLPNETTPAIRISGDDLIVPELTLGTDSGVGGAVGGNTAIERSLQVGTDAGFDALTARGNLTIGGGATLLGDGVFDGTAAQTLTVAGTLEMLGSATKTQGGDFTVDSADILLASTDAQAFGANSGALTITSPLVKEQGSLFLRGATDDDSRPAIVIEGTSPTTGLALEAKNGSIDLSAVTLAQPGGKAAGVGTYQLDGGVTAVGDVTLDGSAILSGKPSYTFTAIQDAGGGSGELTMGGVKSTDADIFLVADGARPTADVTHPAAVHLSGKFDLAKGLFVDGATDVADDTTIEAQGDVEFASRIQGAKNLDVTSHDTVVFHDDVDMSDGAFSARGDNGVLFVSVLDAEQSIQAGSISLGNGAPNPPKNHGSLLRDGDLRLTALNGSVVIGRGQRLVANGALNVSAKAGVTLADTAALGVGIRSSSLAVYAGSTVQGNSISVSARPTVIGGGGATFAVPNRTEVSNSVPSDDVLVRGLNAHGTPLSFASPDSDPTFPLSADFVRFDPIIPPVTGSAVFDYARVIPRMEPRPAITRPRANAHALAESLQERPLWAEELLAYLERQSTDTPTGGDRAIAEADLLPPVGARPGDPIAPNDARVRNAAVDGAVAEYRNLFRPDVRRDPDTGMIEPHSQDAEIRAAFQGPVDVVRHAHSGRPVVGADVAKVFESEAKFAAAQRYRERLSSLIDLGQRALTPEQRPRFRALLLSDVTPYGISPAEFETLF